MFYPNLATLETGFFVTQSKGGIQTIGVNPALTYPRHKPGFFSGEKTILDFWGESLYEIGR